VNGSNYITPIKDQSVCGSCVAFGTTATVEGTFQVQSGRAIVSLSEAQLFYCFAEAQDGRTCLPGLANSGWWPSAALDAYQNTGIVDAACFPYIALDQACNLCADWHRRLTKITGWHTISSTADMKTWLSTHGPLSTILTVYDDFSFYISGIYTPTSTTSVGGHCVCVVGYDDNSGCWICKNSWGTLWGEHGFFRIAYGECGIDAEMWAVEGVDSIMAIGGYDLQSAADRAFAFDYDSSGKLDHLTLYRPGAGAIFILKNNAGQFTPVYAMEDPGSGIGGYDLKNAADQAFTFDYDGSRKLDHLVLYRPGHGAIFILKNSGGQFSPVYAQGDPGNGIGGYDLKNAADQAFAFDYDGSGKLDHLVLYRPGAGTIYILKNTGGQFSTVPPSGGTGIGGYDLRSTADRVFAFDYDGSGKLDHLVLYRPGAGTIYILKNTGGQFSTVPPSGGTGIGGYDLKNTADRVFAFDYDGSGKLDHLVLYRPGHGTIYILKNSGGQFSPVYAQGDPGNGIGGYDLRSAADQAFAFDYDGSGKLDHLVLYRPGSRTMWILKNSGGQFSPVYAPQ
jgi:hypothetical protein